MGKRDFFELVDVKASEGKHVCVGLDSEVSELPPHLRTQSTMCQVDFNKGMVGKTRDIAAAYKMSRGCYTGAPGIWNYRETCRSIEWRDDKKESADNIPFIMDAKYPGETPNSSRWYANEAFAVYGADAVTVDPYMGFLSLEPYMEWKGKGIIILCRTSNEGADVVQEAMTQDGTPLYLKVAREAKKILGERCALVVAGNRPEALEKVRQEVGNDTLILMPGFGAQGALPEDAIQYARGGRFFANASRSIIFASNGEDCFDRAREETRRFDNEIRKFLD